MKYTVSSLFAISVLSVFWFSCQRETAPSMDLSGEYVPVLPAVTENYNVQLTNAGLSVGSIDNDLATLGRVLFYDRALSVSNSISCGSCHLQSKAFSDDVAFSQGFLGQPTGRNSMPIFNLAFNGEFFWDMRVSELKNMVLMPVQHSVEMGFESAENLAMKLQKISYYPDLFSKAGMEEITTENIALALTEFVKSIRSASSPYDKAMNNGLTSFNAQEMRGFNLFNNLHCNTCHSGNNFNGIFFFDGSGRGFSGGGWNGNNRLSLSDIANIGLESNYRDKGISVENQKVFVPEEGSGEGKFKVPSLRNIELTAPYMHDGRFATLEEVIDHYDHGVVAHPDLDDRLKVIELDPSGRSFIVRDEIRKLNLTPEQKADLIAFLKTLTDTEMLNASRFSDPFRLVN